MVTTDPLSKGLQLFYNNFADNFNNVLCPKAYNVLTFIKLDILIPECQSKFIFLVTLLYHSIRILTSALAGHYL